MAVSRRLRFEILTRDNNTCRYCGAKAPDVRLTVDHVLPVALGGGDEAANLVAACVECNGGKSASNPDAAAVAGVAADAERWAAAVKEVARRKAVTVEKMKKSNEIFKDIWETQARKCKANHEYPVSDTSCELPADWTYTLVDMRNAGLNASDILEAIRNTFSRDFYVRSRWRYFSGTAWGILKERHREAAALLAEEPPHNWRNSMDGP